MQRYNGGLFAPTKQKFVNHPIYGFDIETINDNKDFLCASIVPAVAHNHLTTEPNLFFNNRRDLINELKNKKYENAYIVATNLGFDFFGTFHGQPESAKFRLLWRGSDILHAKTYLHDNEMHASPVVETGEKRYKNYKTLTFLDTMNYAQLSVAKLGQLVGVPKLQAPGWLIPTDKSIKSRRPETPAEWYQLQLYNQNDALISAKALEFLFNAFTSLGATPKTTIASTAMSLYKNRYLKHKHWRQPVWLLEEQLKGYYGGRCEAFSRGWFGTGTDNIKYYLGDVNSLYPSVMLLQYPNPSTYKTSTDNTTKYIENFEGMSYVSISAPVMDYPLLPFRHGTKLLFPTGTFSGYYVNAELRKAVQLGYTILRVHKSIYYTENYYPFADYVQDLYAKRLEYQAAESPMELVTKLLLNSLYGKFSQKWKDRIEWQHQSTVSFSQLQQSEHVERVGDYFAMNKGYTEPAAFTIPIWAAHVTAYGRMALYDYITQTQALYCDTDSVITSKPFESSKVLGKLKLVMPIDRGIIVRPKFYALQTDDKDYVKVKGLGKRLVWDDFERLLVENKITYQRFMRFRESIRRGMIPNEIIQQPKTFLLDDDKRDWAGQQFMNNCFMHSKPLQLYDGALESDYLKAARAQQKETDKELNMFINSDKFDRTSVGIDITQKEFLANEIWHEVYDK